MILLLPKYAERLGLVCLAWLRLAEENFPLLAAKNTLTSLVSGAAQYTCPKRCVRPAIRDFL